MSVLTSILFVFALGPSAKAPEPTEATPAPEEAAAPAEGTAPAESTPPATAEPTSEAATAEPLPGESVEPPPGAAAQEPASGASAQAGTAETASVDGEITQPPEPVGPPKEKKRKKGKFNLAWSMGQTVGSSYTFLDRFTVRGIDFGFEYRALPMVSAGVSLGWIGFYDTERKTVERENAALTATQLRRMGTYSILANGTLYLPKRRRVDPFVGLGLGAYFSYRSIDIGWAYTENSGWHFGMSPTLGVEIPIESVSVLLGSRFHWLAKSGDSPEELYFTFNIGLGFLAF